MNLPIRNDYAKTDLAMYRKTKEGCQLAIVDNVATRYVALYRLSIKKPEIVLATDDGFVVSYNGNEEIDIKSNGQYCSNKEQLVNLTTEKKDKIDSYLSDNVKNLYLGC